MGVLVLVIGLSLRVVASFMAVSFGDISLKERFFIALAWLPKATVQAALGPLALGPMLQKLMTQQKFETLVLL